MSRRQSSMLSSLHPLAVSAPTPQISSSVFPKNVLISAHPDSPEGRCASSRVLDRDAVDAIHLAGRAA